jgi:prepilin-type N-terminal cleavage/methylation domain-containing protein
VLPPNHAIMSSRRRAFTLIELLIVITIIGILAVALVPRLSGGPGRARDAQRKADLQTISTALEYYMQDNGEYPADEAGCIPTAAIATYLTTTPVDPSALDGGACTSGTYGYFPVDDNNGYLLLATLETITDKGDGVYNYPLSLADLAETARYNLEQAEDSLCSNGADCTGGATYVVGR